MPPLPSETPRVLIVGMGGIGGVVGCRLLEAGVDLTIATTNAAVRRAWSGGGLSLDGRALSAALPDSRVVESARGQAPFDFVFIAVQPPQIEEVAQSLESALVGNARIVCLSNGLCEERIARVLGAGRVVGAVVAWGARMPTPGSYLQTSKGGFRVGSLSGAEDPALIGIRSLLEHVGEVVFTDNLRGARFSKLALNCAVSTLGTIGSRTLGKLLLRMDARDLALSILREAIAVAEADGLRLEPVTQLDLRWLGQPRSPFGAAAQHALLLGVGLRYRRLRSSMLAAMERGRSPAVDFLNGEIVDRGARLGVRTPVNRAAQEIVWEIAQGRLDAGSDALRALVDRSRALGASS